MSDIFNEVDEEVRREQLKKLWQRYNVYFVAAAILIVALVGGWRFYQWWEAKKAAEAGTAFQAALTLSEQGKYAEAEAAFGKIGETGTAGYRHLSRLQAAAELAQRDPKAAVELYDTLAADAGMPEAFRDLAALRAAMLLVDSASYEDLRRRLEPATAPGRAFRNSARELLALSAWRAGDAATARMWLDAIIADAEATQATRQRVEMLMTLTQASGKS